VPDNQEVWNVEEQNHAYLLFMLFLSLFALVGTGAEMLHISPGAHKILGYSDTFICGVFFLDFVYLFWRARGRRTRYLLTYGWLDLASCIPMIPQLRWSRALRVMRIFRILRCVRSARILVRLVVEKRVQSMLLAACLLVTTMVTVSAISVLHFEAGLSDKNTETNLGSSNTEGSASDKRIEGPEDAIWWSIFTMLNLGYGDKFPVTVEGRIVAAILAFLGLGLFGAFSGFVASRLLGTEEAETATKLDEVKRELVEIKELLRIERHEPSAERRPRG
jgi:voltage-gated potassium channel